uniref:Uncharacterized protein n=1 Tax=Alexandrium catenella TaxID=2925 RepID=A0A7S1MHZ0_ALECA
MDAAVQRRWEAASAVQPRPAPEEVLSLDGDGSLRLVPVPSELRVAADEVEVPEAAAEAWRSLAGEELALLGLELRCRDRLALDLAEVEVDLATGNPSIPVALLGLTLADDGRRCLLPQPDGDQLRFELREYESTAHLEDWIASEEMLHDKLWAGGGKAKQREAVLDQLRRFFTCAEACHARGVRAVEAAELQRRVGTLDFDDAGAVQAEVDSGASSSPDLQDQEGLAQQGRWVVPDEEPGTVFDEIFELKI